MRRMVEEITEDRLERFANRLDRWSKWAAYAACLLAFFIIILPALVQTCAPSARRGGVMEGPERAVFRKLLVKHGLHRQFSVVHYDGKGDPYYYNNRGQRCRFK